MGSDLWRLQVNRFVTLDRRWFIVAPGKKGIVYTPHGATAAEAWSNFSKAHEPLGTGIDRTAAYRMGYRARLCEIFTDA